MVGGEPSEGVGGVSLTFDPQSERSTAVSLLSLSWSELSIFSSVCSCCRPIALCMRFKPGRGSSTRCVLVLREESEGTYRLVRLRLDVDMHCCAGLALLLEGFALVSVEGRHTSTYARSEVHRHVAGREALARVERVEQPDRVQLVLDRHEGAAERACRDDHWDLAKGGRLAADSRYAVMYMMARMRGGTWLSSVRRMRRVMIWRQLFAPQEKLTRSVWTQPVRLVMRPYKMATVMMRSASMLETHHRRIAVVSMLGWAIPALCELTEARLASVARRLQPAEDGQRACAGPEAEQDQTLSCQLRHTDSQRGCRGWAWGRAGGRW